MPNNFYKKHLSSISYIDIDCFKTSSQSVLTGVVLVCFCSRAVREQYWFGSIAGVVQGELILTRSSEVMRVNEVAKDRSCTAIEKDPLHLLLEIERRFRAEERKNLCSARGRSHQNLLRIIKEQSG